MHSVIGALHPFQVRKFGCAVLSQNIAAYGLACFRQTLHSSSSLSPKFGNADTSAAMLNNKNPSRAGCIAAWRVAEATLPLRGGRGQRQRSSTGCSTTTTAGRGRCSFGYGREQRGRSGAGRCSCDGGAGCCAQSPRDRQTFREGVQVFGRTRWVRSSLEGSLSRLEADR